LIPQININVITIFKVDKETSMDANESRKFYKVEIIEKETLIEPSESRDSLVVETTNN
jgi:predicted transcriptional regulator